MSLITAYKCPRCSKMWPSDKKSNYREHLKHHVARDRFRAILAIIEEENAKFISRIESLSGYKDFVDAVTNASVLMFYENRLFKLKEISDIEFVRKIEYYRDLKVKDIFTGTVKWYSSSNGSVRNDCYEYIINFGHGNLFLSSSIWYKCLDIGFELRISTDEYGNSILTGEINHSYFPRGSMKTLRSSLDAMRKLKE